MTQVLRLERYVNNGCMDLEDAEAMEIHLVAIAKALSAVRVPLVLTGRDQELMLHYARLVRIIQRATQPGVVARAACPGVELVVAEIENGRRVFTVRCAEVDVVIDQSTRTLRLAKREQPAYAGRGRQDGPRAAAPPVENLRRCA